MNTFRITSNILDSIKNTLELTYRGLNVLWGIDGLSGECVVYMEFNVLGTRIMMEHSFRIEMVIHSSDEVLSSLENMVIEKLEKLN